MPHARKKSALPAAAQAARPSAGRRNASIAKDSLERLLGYNLRRATLAVLAGFIDRMAVFGLRPVEFSVLTLIHHNPGLTARHICSALDILPPNLVGLVSTFEKRQLIRREPHPQDGRAIGLHLTAGGVALMLDAEAAAAESEGGASALLTAAELATLMRLLKKLYQRPE